MGASFHPGLNNFKLSSDVFSGEGWRRVLTLNEKKKSQTYSASPGDLRPLDLEAFSTES